MSKLQSLDGFSRRIQNTSPDDDTCKESLVDLIETQLIPRLLQSENYNARMANQASVFAPLDPLPQLDAFAMACRNGDSLRVNAIIDGLLSSGHPHQQIFLNLITPAAQQLGDLWDKDLCSFSDVTCGLAIMHQITYRLGYEYRDGPQSEGLERHVMLCAAPGSLHILGVTIVADLFKREGASVVIDISASEEELVRSVANEWFDLIGISVAIESQLYKLKSLIENLRAHSGNPDAKVLLGGPIFSLVDATAEMFGADLISTSPLDVLAMLKANPHS